MVQSAPFVNDFPRHIDRSSEHSCVMADNQKTLDRLSHCSYCLQMEVYMAKRLAVMVAFLFLLVPVVSFAQSGNNCISWLCFTPPDNCSYCGTVITSGNSRCSPNGNDGEGCWAGGYCDTGTSGSCYDEGSCIDN